jgi:hypothetical protein
MALISFGLALLSMLLIRVFAGVFVWLTLLAFIGAFVALGVEALRTSNKLASTTVAIASSTNSTFYNATNMKIAAIICFVIAGLSLLIVLFSLSTISLCIAIIKTASIFITQTLQIILVPVFFASLTIGYLIFWCVELAYLWSIGTGVKGTSSPFV